MRISWYKDLGKSTNLQQNREISDIRIDYNISDWCSKCTKYPKISSRISAWALHWFVDWTFAENDHTKFLKLYRKIWPKFEQVIKKKRTDPSDVKTLSYRWKIYFWFFCSLLVHKESLSLCAKREKKIKSGFSIENKEFPLPLFCATHRCSTFQRLSNPSIRSY